MWLQVVHVMYIFVIAEWYSIVQITKICLTMPLLGILKEKVSFTTVCIQYATTCVKQKEAHTQVSIYIDELLKDT